MATRPTSKWIDFSELPRSRSGKTRRFDVVVKDPKPDLLADEMERAAPMGTVSWYGAWRRYAFWPTREIGTVFESQCLRDIAAFCDWLMAERKG